MSKALLIGFTAVATIILAQTIGHCIQRTMERTIAVMQTNQCTSRTTGQPCYSVDTTNSSKPAGGR